MSEERAVEGEERAVEASVALFPYVTDQYVVLIRFKAQHTWKNNGAGQKNGWWLDSVWDGPGQAELRASYLRINGW